MHLSALIWAHPMASFPSALHVLALTTVGMIYPLSKLAGLHELFWGNLERLHFFTVRTKIPT